MMMMFGCELTMPSQMLDMAEVSIEVPIEENRESVLEAI